MTQPPKPISEMTVDEYIAWLEQEKYLYPDCKTCQDKFYRAIRFGQRFADIFAPRHEASSKCQSGKHPHCSCNTCF